MTGGGTLTASEGSLRLCCTGGESPPFQFDARRGLARRKKGFPLQPKGASGSAAPGVGAPSATKVRSATRNDGRRRNTATGGSRGSAAPEGEPRPMLKKQRGATDGGDSHCVRRELRLCCHRKGESRPSPSTQHDSDD